MENNNQTQDPKGKRVLVLCKLYPEKFHRLDAIGREQAEEALAKIVVKAMLYRGQRQDTDTVGYVVSSLLDELQRNESNVWYLTVEEIGYTIRENVLQDPDFYISVASLYRAIVAYTKNEGHEAAAIANNQRARLKQQTTAAETFIQAKAVDINDKFKTN